MKTRLSRPLVAASLLAAAMPGCRSADGTSLETLPPIVNVPLQSPETARGIVPSDASAPASSSPAADAALTPGAAPAPSRPALEQEQAVAAQDQARRLADRANDLRVRVDYLASSTGPTPIAPFELRRQLDELRSALREIDGHLLVLRTASSEETAQGARRELERTVTRAEQIYFDASTRLAAQRPLSP